MREVVSIFSVDVIRLQFFVIANVVSFNFILRCGADVLFAGPGVIFHSYSFAHHTMLSL